MALYNEILAGRFNRLLQKMLQLKGPAPAPQLSSEITPALDVEDIPVELRVLMNYNLYGVALQVPAVAAQNAGAQLRNPLGSGVIAVIEQIFFSASAASVAAVTTAYNNPANMTNSFVGTRRDLRAQGTSQIPSSGNNFADLAFGLYQGTFAAASMTPLILDRHQEIPVLPGQAVRVNNSTQNTQTWISIIWRERAIEESELTA
jgi:hypothetical protein